MDGSGNVCCCDEECRAIREYTTPLGSSVEEAAYDVSGSRGQELACSVAARGRSAGSRLQRLHVNQFLCYATTASFSAFVIYGAELHIGHSICSVAVVRKKKRGGYSANVVIICCHGRQQPGPIITRTPPS